MTGPAAHGPAEDPRDAALLAMLRGDASHWAAVPAVPGVHGLVEIASGGQGRVYRGRRIGDERVVAVKVLHAAEAAREVARRRFEREVELLAELDHPGIVPVLAHGFAGARPYLVMAFVEGRPLHRMATDGTIDRQRRIAILVQLADAVSHAHARGVLHRDLSPSNVLVGADDQVTVLDFGLARAVAAAPGRSAISVSGDFVGSVAWAAPEQFSGDPGRADVRTDVHAIGAIGHLLLTGHPPRDASEGLPAMIRAITEGPAPSPRAVAPDLPEDLTAILERCLARDPDDRYAAAADVRDDLRRVQRGEPIAARQSGAWRRAQRSLARSRRLLVGTAAASVLLAGIAAGAVMLADRASEAERQADAALAESRRQEARMRQTLDVLLGALDSVDPHDTARTRPATAEDVLGAVEARVMAGGLPADARAEVLTELCRIRMNRGEYALAEALASAVCTLLDGGDDASLGAALMLRGLARHGVDRHEDALADLMAAARRYDAARASVAAAGDARGGGRRSTSRAWMHRFNAEEARVHAAATMGSLGDLDGMQAMLEGVVARTDTERRPIPGIAAVAHRRLAESWSHRGVQDRALEHAARARTLLDRTGATPTFESADLERLLASIALGEGRWSDAREAAARAVASHRALMRTPHPLGVMAMAIEAQALARLGETAAASARVDEVRRLREQVVSDRSRFSAELLQRMADALRHLGREAEAREAWAMAADRDDRIPTEPVWARARGAVTGAEAVTGTEVGPGGRDGAAGGDPRGAPGTGPGHSSGEVPGDGPGVAGGPGGPGGPGGGHPPRQTTGTDAAGR